MPLLKGLFSREEDRYTHYAKFYVIMKSHFEIFKSPKDDQFYWRLRAANGEIVLRSEGYTSKQSAEKGIASVRVHSPSDENYTRFIAKNKEYAFNLKAKNNEIIGWGETYKTAQGRDHGIEVVKQIAPDAPIEDLTEIGEEAKAVSTTEGAGGLSVCAPSGGHSIPVKPKGGYYAD